MPLPTKEQRIEYGKRYRARNREAILKWNKEYYKKLRLAAINYYSLGLMNCKCCGEDEYKFLNIDHVNNDGRKHRKELRSGYIMNWLKSNNYPTGFQVLCYNCNMAKGYYGICPHEGEINEPSNNL